MSQRIRTYAPWIAGGALIAAIGGGAYGLTNSTKVPAVDSTQETISLVVEPSATSPSGETNEPSAASETPSTKKQPTPTPTAQAPGGAPAPQVQSNNGQVAPYIPPPNIQTWGDDDWDDDWGDDWDDDGDDD